jgi:hypothetical protein
MGEPSKATLKKLFAVSGNRCAFPKCKERLIEESSGTLVGKVCHIKGNAEGAKRHDKSQTEGERQGVGNLIVLCGKHHDVIDDDEESYTVPRLLKMKADHEANYRGTPQTDDASERFAAAIYNTVTNGSIIQVKNQSGGQTAHSIVNNYGGQADRQIGSTVAEALIAELRSQPGEFFKVISRSQGADTMRLARRIQEVLTLSGWAAQENLTLAISPDTQDTEVVVAMPEAKTSYSAILDCMRRAGVNARGEIRMGLKVLEISVTER